MRSSESSPRSTRELWSKALARTATTGERPREIVAIDIAVEPVLDLTNRSERRRLGIRLSDIRSDEADAIEHCRTVADVARATGQRAILAPSAARVVLRDRDQDRRPAGERIQEPRHQPRGSGRPRLRPRVLDPGHPRVSGGRARARARRGAGGEAPRAPRGQPGSGRRARRVSARRGGGYRRSSNASPASFIRFA